MASSAYYAWVSDGRPYRLCRPAAALQRTLRTHGLVVYDYPDDSHLKASTPEDHTPFSATGWPGKSAYGVGHADDIMPRSDTPAGRKESADIARRLIADRNAGVPGVMWIKYINWTDEQGVCRQERWMPNHETRSSTDKGHIHVSGRSDCDNDVRADNYDPLEVDVNLTDKVPGTGTPATKGADRTLGDLLKDIGSLRAVLIGELSPAAAGFGPSTPLGQLLTLAAAGPAKPLDLTALAQGLAPVLAPMLQSEGVEVTAEQLVNGMVAALESQRGQAAITAAADKAEDS